MLAALVLMQRFLLAPSEKSIHASLTTFASWSDWCPGLVSRPGLYDSPPRLVPRSGLQDFQDFPPYI